MADPGFSPGGVPTPKIAIIFHIFAENCMKMKEFGPPGGARVPGAPLGSANELCNTIIVSNVLVISVCFKIYFLIDHHCKTPQIRQKLLKNLQGEAALSRANVF